MKLNLIYYKNILDIAVKDFFDVYNSDFTNIGGYYVLGKAISKQQLEDFFTKSISNALLKHVSPFKLSDPNYYFVIGSCMPNDNILLDFKNDKQYFPTKLGKLLKSGIQLKYVLHESDIKIDIILFNDIFIRVFDKFFSDREFLHRSIGKQFTNVFFIQHKNFDCYTMFKTIKFLYGKSNCTNIWKDCLQNDDSYKDCLVSINELVSKYINNKLALNKSLKFKEKVHEVKFFMDQLLNV